MENIGIFYNGLLTVILLVLVGIFLGWRKIFPVNISKVVSNLLLMVAMPAALFNSFPNVFDADLLFLFIKAVLFAVLVMTAAVLVARLLFSKRRLKEHFREHQFAFIFNNASFIGYPLVSATFGVTGLIPYAGLMSVFSFFLFTYGVHIFEKKLTWRSIAQALLNPNIIAVSLGLIFFLFSISLPEFATTTIKHLANLTTPLSLLLIGALLSQADWKQLLTKKRLFVTCALQLLLVPTLVYLLLYIFNAPLIIRQVFVLIQALPTATSLALFAEKYNGNAMEASELVFISTVMSVVTLPVVAYFLL